MFYFFVFFMLKIFRYFKFSFFIDYSSYLDVCVFIMFSFIFLVFGLDSLRNFIVVFFFDFE